MDETYNDMDGMLLGFGKINAEKNKHISKHLAYKVTWKITDKKGVTMFLEILPCYL